MSTKRKAVSELTCTRSLKVGVIKARGLAPKDANGLSDPYALIQIGAVQMRTQTVMETLDPKWNESFEFEDVSVGVGSTRFSPIHFDSSLASLLFTGNCASGRLRL